MALTNQERWEIFRDFMEGESGQHFSIDLLKVALRDAVDATDDFIGTNVAAYNVALPEPARTNLTTRQKALMFLLVADKRFEVL